ncbi:bacterioferritin [Candidatus Profftella armatura (Diaphorina cf. continua)]|uniref:Bacterioferritin n=1 Tax=Candidatus Profftella armatura (Diaphorina cf. continua) TaxID=2661583 RepID=A0A7R7ABR7_9PROT|nr:bacterioferritin [Candidatus Profftella armatura (Diaphorina cf. continua)]BCG49621.1 bacterioferritin [Candidatus Profftella armatura (Diaphorina cf. continua)]
MKDNSSIIQVLNFQLINELSAANQYFLHSKICKNWGFIKISKKEYKESIEEMKHADQLIDRILMLNGEPNMRILHQFKVSKNIIEILKNDLKLEKISQITIKKGILSINKFNDYISQNILINILCDTEKHIYWLEMQLKLIKKIGLSHYIQL